MGQTIIEMLETFEEDLPDMLEALRSNLIDDIKEIGKPEPRGDENWDWVAQKVYECQIKNISEYRLQMIKRITRYIESKQNPRPGRITDNDIARAKEFPIQDLYAGKLRKMGKQYCGLCPFHTERTPSFYIKNNRYTCYGCGEYGDSIAFYMKTNGVTFIQAVKKLNS